MASVQSIQRAFDLLEALADGELGVTDLADRSSLPKSTVSRMMKTLEGVGAVEKDASARYRIGPAIGRLAGAPAAAADLTAKARSHLVFLATTVGEDAGLSVPDGHLVHYIDQANAENDVQVRDWTGDLAYMHAVPSGLMIMAHWPQAAVKRYLEKPLVSYTSKTVTAPGAIERRLVRVRRAGHCWVKEEFAEGISSVAAPILDPHGVAVGALHVHGPSYRFPGRNERAVATVVMERAAMLSDQVNATRS